MAERGRLSYPEPTRIRLGENTQVFKEGDAGSRAATLSMMFQKPPLPSSSTEPKFCLKSDTPDSKGSLTGGVSQRRATGRICPLPVFAQPVS